MMTNIPKRFISALTIPEGPFEGRHASPCLCGYPTNFEEGQTLHLIQWQSGEFMLCHEGCIPPPDDD